MGTQPQRLAPKRTLKWSDVGSELVILDQAMGELLRLNPVGGFIWKQLDGGRSTGEIVESVCRQFAIEPSAAEADVERFLSQLRSMELVEEPGENR